MVPGGLVRAGTVTIEAGARGTARRGESATGPLRLLSMSREDEEACKNPLLVMADERSGSRYARAVGVKGLGEANSMDWLIEGISATLKSWGHAGGTGGEIILKSDGEPALLAVRSAVMKYHGGIMIPESPAKCEKAENRLIEEAGGIVREFVCTFMSQIEYGIDDR